MNYKIVQIIPVNKEMYAVHKNGAETLIVGLALVEDESKNRFVLPLDITNGDGIIDLITDFFELKII